MPRTWKWLPGLLAVVLIAAPAKDIVRGDWSLTQGTAGGGTPVCVLMHDRRADAPVRNFAIKGFANRDFLVLTLYKETWQLNKGETPVTLGFGDGQPLTFQAVTDGPIIDIDLRRDLTADMLISVAKNTALQIRFPDLPEGHWIIPLHERQMVDDFSQCWQRLHSR